MRGDVRDGYPKPDCSGLWEKHRLHKRVFWGLFVGWIPYGFLVIETFFDVASSSVERGIYRAGSLRHRLGNLRQRCLHVPLSEMRKPLLRLGTVWLGTQWICEEMWQLWPAKVAL